VKFGLYALHRGDNIEPANLRARALEAEAAGFESLWVGDHIALPDDAPDPADEPRLEAVSVLTYLAAVTTRVRLGAGVLILPQRQPVLLAKQLTSLDLLSAGRLIVGVGIGYVEAELAALGSTLAERAPRTDESLAVLDALWRHEPDFTGRFVEYHGVSQHPAPVQRPRPPIVVGGHAEGALQRAARHGDGWFGWQLTVEQAARFVERLRARRPSGAAPLEITVVARDQLTRDLVGRYEDVGVDRLVVLPDEMTTSATAAVIERVATELIG
jgi:probable F420-dependent oxidoreductase